MTVLSEKSKGISIILTDLYLIFMSINQLSLARLVSNRRSVAVAIKGRTKITDLRCTVAFLSRHIGDINLRRSCNFLRCGERPGRLFTD